MLRRRRLLPEGVLTGVAAVLKLTPAIFVLYLLAVRRWRAALTAAITAGVLTLLAAVVLPRESLDFWTRLAHGDTGLGHSLIYYTNQSVLADFVRIFGLGPAGIVLGLLASAAVVALGVWAAALWHRAGDVRLAVMLCGVASLLASPVSWLHHFVWVVPLAFSLVELVARRPPVVPTWLLVLGWGFVGWVIVSPFRRLPNGGDLELTWTAGSTCSPRSRPSSGWRCCWPPLWSDGAHHMTPRSHKRPEPRHPRPPPDAREPHPVSARRSPPTTRRPGATSGQRQDAYRRQDQLMSGFAPCGTAAGRSHRLTTPTVAPASEASAIRSITSCTWKPSSALCRCGAPSPIARARSDSP